MGCDFDVMSQEYTDWISSELLTQDEVGELPMGAIVWVRWGGGNGPWRYFIWREWGQTRAVILPKQDVGAFDVSGWLGPVGKEEDDIQVCRLMDIDPVSVIDRDRRLLLWSRNRTDGCDDWMRI